ncbi:tol-pal system protein YbgF [Curvibacter sp. CHRR-16]|uniref:tol-pal system protein YbgF n=1 Tax=Curvibacter sp. CHRR-16 TaxID=2835872 RepID=UPI001BDA745E|nr:tol-pal system protein YbgF [Curvibacter sp. CHRR-16]MBT0571788.1 tol-pal system protein YbgF [Curvibacter sp. CHRR-16]
MSKPFAYKTSALALALLVVSGTSSAGLFEDDEARRAILDLRQKVEELRAETDRKQSTTAQELSGAQQEQSNAVNGLRQSLQDILNQLEQIKADQAKLRGQNEQLSKDVSDLQRQLRDANQITDERLRNLEPLTVTVDGQSFKAQQTEKKDFESALATLRQGDFDAAQTLFTDFLNRYGSSGYKPSALFWLGSAQYAVKNYKDAITTLRQLLTAAPTHQRAPEAMLTVANSQLEMKDTKAAKKTFEDVQAKYPGTDAASVAKSRATKLK